MTMAAEGFPGQSDVNMPPRLELVVPPPITDVFAEGIFRPIADPAPIPQPELAAMQRDGTMGVCLATAAILHCADEGMPFSSFQKFLEASRIHADVYGLARTHEQRMAARERAIAAKTASALTEAELNTARKQADQDQKKLTAAAAVLEERRAQAQPYPDVFDRVKVYADRYYTEYGQRHQRQAAIAHIHLPTILVEHPGLDLIRESKRIIGDRYMDAERILRLMLIDCGITYPEEAEPVAETA